jgi:dihydroxy-acid dehydratase
MATKKQASQPAVNFRRYSSEVVDGLKQAPSRAMLRAVGYKDADFKKPAIGIASTWSNLTPCNMHIDKLAKAAAAAVDSSGGKSTTFGTITVSDLAFRMARRECVIPSCRAR